MSILNPNLTIKQNIAADILNFRKNKAIVDIDNNNKFTENDLKIHKELINWPEAYPDIFGTGLPEEIEFVEWRLINLEDIDYNSQKFRAGGRTTKEKFIEIKQNIKRNGFKLRYPSICLFQNNTLDLNIITGNTRTEILKELGFKNAICAIFKSKTKKNGEQLYSNEQINESVETMGGVFNTIHDPAGSTTKADIIRLVKLSCDRWKRTKGQCGTKTDLHEIGVKVDKLSGNGLFQQDTRQRMVYEIYNNYNPDNQVLSWTPKKVESWIKDNNFINTDKCIYIVASSGLPSKALTRAVALSSENPDKEIRIILNPGTLSGYDLKQCYENTLSSFVKDMKIIIKHYCESFFGVSNPKQIRITVYGAVPSLSSVHNLEKLVYFNNNSSDFYQKKDEAKENYSFNINDDKVSTISDFIDEEDE